MYYSYPDAHPYLPRTASFSHRGRPLEAIGLAQWYSGLHPRRFGKPYYWTKVIEVFSLDTAPNLYGVPVLVSYR